MSERESTDSALIDRARAGDETAFRTLVERYESQVAATVVGMLGPSEEADDVGQETFVRFYQALGKFRGEAALGTYLTRIAMNLSLNAIKRRQKQRWRFWSLDDDKKPRPSLVLTAATNWRLRSAVRRYTRRSTSSNRSFARWWCCGCSTAIRLRRRPRYWRSPRARCSRGSRAG